LFAFNLLKSKSRNQGKNQGKRIQGVSQLDFNFKEKMGPGILL